MSENKSYTETYKKRRTIEAGEPVEVVIEDVGYTSKSSVGFVIEAGGEYYVAEFLQNSNIDSEYFISQLSNWDCSSSEVLKTEMCFGPNMSSCGFGEEGEYEFDLDHLGNSYDSQKLFDESDNKYFSALEFALLWSEYNSTDQNEDEGWRHSITDVDGRDDDSFSLEIITEQFVSLEWVLEVPLTTEDSHSQVAKLVEEQGGGRPDLVDSGGVVNVLHKSDVPSDLNIIAYDKTGNWALVNTSVFESWVEKKRTNSATTSSSIRTRRNRNYATYVYQGVAYGLFSPLLIDTVMKPMLLSGISESSTETTVELTQAVIPMIDTIVNLSMLMGLILIIYSILGMTIQD